MTTQADKSTGIGTPGYPTSTVGAMTDTRSHGAAPRVSNETKPSYKTTEFLAYILSVVGVLIASNIVGSDNNTGRGSTSAGDYFRADRAWLFITVLTVGYMISRGLAKAGSRDDHHNH